MTVRAAGVVLSAAAAFAGCAAATEPRNPPVESRPMAEEPAAVAAPAPPTPHPSAALAEEREESARQALEQAKQDGKYGAAAELFDQAARLYAEAGDTTRQGYCVHQRASCLKPEAGKGSAEEWSLSRDLFREAVRLRAEAGDQRGHLVSLWQVAHCLLPSSDRWGGDWEESRVAYEEVARIASEIGNRSVEASANYSLGSCIDPDNRGPEGDWERARKMYRVAAMLYGEEQDHKGQAKSLYALATCLRPSSDPDGGDWSQAAAVFGAAAAQYERSPNSRMHAQSLVWQAHCLISVDEVPRAAWSEARSLFDRAREIQHGLGDSAGAGYCLRRMAQTCRPDHDRFEGNWRKAANLYRRAESCGWEANDADLVVRALRGFGICNLEGRLAKTVAEWEKVASAFVEASRLRATTALSTASCYDLYCRAVALAFAAELDGNWDRAVEAFEETAELYREAGDLEWEAECERWVALCTSSEQVPKD